MNENLLTEADTAQMLAISPSTLRNQRSQGKRENRMPVVPFVRLSPRCVRYRLEDVKAIISKNTIDTIDQSGEGQ